MNKLPTNKLIKSIIKSIIKVKRQKGNFDEDNDWNFVAHDLKV